MKTKEEKISLLNETAEFYQTHERCIVGSVCQYHLQNFPHGCAVGRLFKTEEERKEFQLSHSSESIDSKRNFIHLPEYIREWGVDFLKAIQFFHDQDDHFLYGKLTEMGDLYIKKVHHQIMNGHL